MDVCMKKNKRRGQPKLQHFSPRQALFIYIQNRPKITNISITSTSVISNKPISYKDGKPTLKK